MKFAHYVKIRQEKFGAVIFETLSEKVYVTNETGSDILKLLQQGEPPDNIVKTLKDDYGEDGVQIESDVIEFIDKLKKTNILVE